MRACQLCGVASWGPLKDPSRLAGLVAIVNAVFLECDNCRTPAREDLIADAVLSADFAPLSSRPMHDPFGSVLGAMPALFKGMLPEKDPETRTERLVRELIRSETVMNDILINVESESNSARALVKRARAIETELDAVSVTPRDCTDIRPRNFQVDFLAPALTGLGSQAASRVGMALDCAIVFGALEGQRGNESLKDNESLERGYWRKVEQLKGLVL